ncbi:Uncharacterised protein [uncultured Clostridium sp.]|nr:Uncharacterised protein [uncultured Clostridium sp.]SCJ04641.1 Uncharacterised protein [uncultured Clostridium sp.]
MSSIPQNYFVENDLIDCIQRFFPKSLYIYCFLKRNL